ncbi:class I SAM-dependent methyltransferase [Iamia sp. SCSIO 61187]|uniref:SAM-dependent methyltransferase n=1 Tax=Iamia sp. SCSIO 61187 TaxID=2722752 RepID=UPI001C62692B|nr:cyclopropane-fatty-acyl-phospholipid synthase family protein [Iamia sp. SCSIO 61187]QYG94163.1 class I SAM-dependent methyltransferase [Iamia sp. SCSIO 61187]
MPKVVDALSTLSFLALDRGLVPTPVLHAACRGRVAKRLRTERAGTLDERSDRFRALVQELRSGAVTTHTAEANEQHYEVPTRFFEAVLGPRLKYSSCLYPPGVDDLAAAEVAMLELYGERARLADGQRILELGCGWGSLTLWMAETYPDAEVVALSNSRTQREHIEKQAADRGLANVHVITADVATFDPADHGEGAPFDRVVSVEMLEHVRNHGVIFERIARWLADDGLFFTHVFAGRDVCFRYDADDRRDWMARHFFSGGLMPRDDLFLHLQDDLAIVDHWTLSGVHYQRTSLAWLANLETHRAELDRLVGTVQVRRWRAFFAGCAALFGHDDGEAFGVSHYLFRPRTRP